MLLSLFLSKTEVTPNWWIQVPLIIGALAVGIPFLLKLFIAPMIREEFDKMNEVMVDHLRWEHGQRGAGGQGRDGKTNRRPGVRYRSDDGDETHSDG